MTDNEDEYVEYDVDVSFHGERFILTIRCTTDTTALDETIVGAASGWFFDTYGFEPAAHADRIEIDEVDRPTRRMTHPRVTNRFPPLYTAY